MMWLVALALISAGLVAQEGEEPRRHGIFLESVEVTLVNVEVLATRDGRPVTDLTVDDFTVFDDGAPIEITHFTRVERASVPRARSTDAEAGAPDPNGPTTVIEPARVIVLVDQLFVSQTSRKRVFDVLETELVPLIESGALVMVAAKTHDDVTIEQGFTSSPGQIETVLSRLEQSPSADYTAEIRAMAELWNVTPRAVESRQTGPGQPPPSSLTSELDAQSAFRDARGLSQRIHADATASMTAIDRFVDSLAGLPGRKAVLYVADRLPTRPAELLWRIWWQEYGAEHGSKFGVTPTGPGDLDTAADLEALIADANTSRVVFYPIGAGSGPSLSTADSRGLTTQARVAAGASESGSGDGLRWLAQRTGGRDAVRFSAFEELFASLRDDLGAYYSLAYPSPHAGDGKIHEIEVRSSRAGVDLRYPTEYRDKSADQRMNDRLLSALSLGVEDNALDIRVAVGKGKKLDKGLFTIPLELNVPLANLVLLPETRSHVGKVSVQILARDDEGRLSDPVIIRMPLEVFHGDMPRALSQTVDYATDMTLGSGPHSIAVGVRDDLGFATSTVTVEIDVGAQE